MILKEKLNLNGKIGCTLCIVGAVVIVFYAPAQAAVTDIDEFKHFVIQPVAPKYGKKHPLVYITVCSLIGSLTVVATQGLGAAIVLNITKGIPQFNHWFIYVTMVFVVCTLIIEVNYLNKALNLFNTAMVTPVYYVFFTSATLVSSVILFQGFSASPLSIMTVVLGFFVICVGVVLLQTSKSTAHSEAIKKSKSALELQSDDGYNDDKGNLILEDEKDDLDPGPIGLRVIPYSLFQMIHASTMTNHAAHGHGQSNNHQDSHYTSSGFFSRKGLASSPDQTPQPHLQNVVIVSPKDEGAKEKVTTDVSSSPHER
ncbi:hypothetical protein BGZ65_005705 [Modicella reniformis]|uniref:DUF803-domain-containing protein n=1 Tax=Modicella reniformis TaxID=1440133 RepID=A0A9P6IMY0_9FUNG|nr:hypothetical protein BGZ65_005705 [Modicella reniformis]